MILSISWPLAKMALIQILLCLPLAFALEPQKVLPTFEESGYGPSIDTASSNAASIFNTIHSSMRQWGSSIQHNGMSLFPAVVPEGTLLYHGDCRAEPPEWVDWMAFEIAHAEMFSLGFCRPIPNPDDRRHVSILELQLEEGGKTPHRPRPIITSGWLQIYQTNRPLKLLYIDGMGAAKCDFGPLDTQDFLLSLTFDRHFFDEAGRAKQLCELAADWDLDGFIRMEAGFEIIKCEFSEGMDLLSARKRPPLDSTALTGGFSVLEYIRDVSNRYNGIDASRVLLDYSSMVSAYFYPTNLSNPDPESNLPRLLYTTPAQLSRIRSDLGDLIMKADPYTSVNWQGVVDMVAKEYSDRLQFMATDPPQREFIVTVNSLLNLYVDYDDLAQDPVETCSKHYLLPVQPRTAQDRLIHAALSTVTHKICTTLFAVRDILFKEQRTPESYSSSSAVELVRSLMTWLDWPDWKLCGQCALDEVCFVAVFPMGTAEDHFHPSCKNRTRLEELGRAPGYWWPGPNM